MLTHTFQAEGLIDAATASLVDQVRKIGNTAAHSYASGEGHLASGLIA